MSNYATVTPLNTAAHFTDLDVNHLTDNQLYRAVTTNGLCSGAVTDKASGAEADEVWFANRTITADEAAKACAGCPVIAECLERALRLGIDHGVFGGTTPEQRRAMLRQAVA
jgi:hypothetical protein